MPRKLLIPLFALGATLLLVTGVIAGVLIADNDDESGVSAQPTVSSTATAKGYLGLTVTVASAGGGLRVATVVPDGPADEAGIKVGDVIRSIEGKVVRTPEQLRSAIESHKPGETISITYERGDAELRAEAKLETAPANAQVESTPTPAPTPADQQTVSGGRLGVTIRQITPQLQQRLNLQRDNGVVIINVAANSAAANAQLQQGDVILVVGATQIKTVQELQRAILAAPVNQAVDIIVERGTEQVNAKVVLPPQSNLDGLGDLLPPELRDRLQSMLDQGTLPPGELQSFLRLFQNRGQGVQVGTVKSVNPGFVPPTFILTMSPYGGGSDVTIELNDKTSIKRGLNDLQPADLKQDDLVLVISMDNGRTAFLIYDFGKVNL